MGTPESEVHVYGVHGWLTAVGHIHSLHEWFTGLVHIHSSQVCTWVLHSPGTYASLLAEPCSLDDLNGEIKTFKIHIVIQNAKFPCT